MCENQPVSKIRMRSPGESVFARAASAAPVPDEGKIDDGSARAEDAFEPLEDLEAKLGELGSPVVDGRLSDFFQNTIGNVRRTRDLQEMASGMNHMASIRIF